MALVSRNGLRVRVDAVGKREHGEGARVSVVDAKATKLKGDASRLVAAGMDRLLHDESSESYKRAFVILGALVILMSLAMSVMAGTLLYTVKKGRTGDRYYAMSFNSESTPLQALDTPSLNATAMLSWVSMAMTDIMTFGFNDINARMDESAKYFTDIGYQSFIIAAQSAGMIQTITQKQQIMTAIPTGMPIVLYEGFVKGIYTWRIQVPIVLTLRAGSANVSAYPEVIVTLVRVPTRKNPNGFGIQKLVIL